ncbi:MAG: hypothetical protein KC635_03265, partial [Myxococcales bacterium]|nr:hypothetical protein [Myxococcales bacterium]
CGCDGVTYSNACFAAAAGASVAHVGACEIGCGGFLGIPCPDGMICDLPAGLCGGADLMGVCVDKPRACLLPYIAPVCGCDGVTYANDCFRLMAGAQADHDGRCEPSFCCDPAAEPGQNGNPICFEGATCCADGTWRCNAGDGSPTCGPERDPADPTRAAGEADASTDVVTVPVGGGEGEVCEACCDGPAPECATSQCCGDGTWSCGGCDVIGHECEARTCHENADCRDAAYCKKAGCEAETGECVARPLACPDVYSPVCGCDGVTYGNRCDAAANGANVAHEGACERVCGGLLGTPCPDGSYCDLPAGVCGGADFQGVCVVIGDFCPTVWDPVCACDGTTYANDCFRVMDKAQKDHDGRCEPTHCCLDGAPPCQNGATCCADGEWRCNTLTGGSTCDPATDPATAMSAEWSAAEPAQSDEVVVVPPGGGTGEICEACCDPDLALDCATAECCGDGRWSCGGCDVVGHVCEPECPGVACTLYCEYGFRTGPDGCEICACRERPSPSPSDR